MIILSIKTNQPEAEVALFNDKTLLSRVTWHAHIELAETIHSQIKKMLGSAKYTWQDVGGVIVYEGPGSFTGLRIGISIGNSLAYGLGLPITSSTGKNWQSKAIKLVLEKKSKDLVMPEYGSPPHITQPKR